MPNLERRGEPESDDLPGDWRRLRFDLTGSFKIRALFGLPADGVERQYEATLQISPHKTETGVPGFPNCHRIEVREYDVVDPPAREVFGESISQTEHNDETLELARILMEDYLEKRPDESAAEGMRVGFSALREGDRVRIHTPTAVELGDFLVVDVDPDLDRDDPAGSPVRIDDALELGSLADSEVGEVLAANPVRLERTSNGRLRIVPSNAAPIETVETLRLVERP